MPPPGTDGPVVSDASVREKRGAGAGWTSPSRSTYTPRALLCGCSAASVERHDRPRTRRCPRSLGPLGLGALLDPRRSGAQVAERGEVVAVRHLAGEPEQVQELLVELRLERRHRHVPAVGGLVDVVVRHAAVEQVRAPAARGDAAGVDDGAASRSGARCRPRSRRRPPGPCRRPAPRAAPRAPRSRGTSTRRRSHRAGWPGSADGRGPGRGRTARRRPRCSSCRGPRTAPAGRPAPTRSSAPYTSRGLRARHTSGPRPSRSVDARAHPLDQHVGPLDQPQHGLHRLRLLEVQRHAGAATGEQVVRAAAQRRRPGGRRAPRRHRGRPGSCTRGGRGRSRRSRPP